MNNNSTQNNNVDDIWDDDDACNGSNNIISNESIITNNTDDIFDVVNACYESSKKQDNSITNTPAQTKAISKSDELKKIIHKPKNIKANKVKKSIPKMDDDYYYDEYDEIADAYYK